MGRPYSAVTPLVTVEEVKGLVKTINECGKGVKAAAAPWRKRANWTNRLKRREGNFYCDCPPSEFPLLLSVLAQCHVDPPSSKQREGRRPPHLSVLVLQSNEEDALI